MIDMRLTGGLGNQLFQFGAAVVLSRHFDLPIRLWAGAMQHYATRRDLVLPHLLDLNRLRATVCERPSWIQRTRLARLAPGVHGRTAWVSDRNVLAVAHQTSRLRSAQLDGYFIESIDQAFFDEALDLLRPATAAPDPAARPENRVCAMHIRGGDFLKLGWALEDALSYYQTSLARVREREPGVRIVAVTDDRDYAGKLLRRLGEDAEVAPGGLLSNFDLLRTADFAILSNSTFSFWAGAWRHGSCLDWSTLAPDSWRPGTRRMIRLRSEAQPQ